MSPRPVVWDCCRSPGRRLWGRLNRVGRRALASARCPVRSGRVYKRILGGQPLRQLVIQAVRITLEPPPVVRWAVTTIPFSVNLVPGPAT